MNTWLAQALRAVATVLTIIGSWGVEFAGQANQSGDTAAVQSPAYALSGPVGDVLVQPDGSILIAGGGWVFFTTGEAGMLGSLNGTVARFHPDGLLDYSFGCRAEPPNYSSVFDTHLALRSDGRLLMTGPFHTVNDQPRAGVAMLLPNGRLDPDFVPWRGVTNALEARSFHPPNLHPAAFDANGHVVVPCVKPNPITAELRIWRMDDSGRVTGTLQPDSVLSQAFSSLLSALTERGFWLFRPVDWEHSAPTDRTLHPPKSPAWMFPFFMSGPPLSAGDASEILRTIFAEVPLELCRNAARLPDGSTILLVQEGDWGRFMRFDKDWRPDLSYTNRLRARSYLSLALQPDGKLLIGRGGDLQDGAGRYISGVVRVNADGSLDPSFRCETDERVMCLAVQGDGRILIGGFFGKVNGEAAPWFARLSPDGSVDRSFQLRFTSVAGLMAGRRVRVTSLASGPDAAATPTAGSEVAVSTIPAPSVIITSLTVTEGTAVMQFQGAPSQAYILQARNALDTGAWSSVATTRTDASGSGALRDPGASDSPMRFYRVATP